MQTKIPLYFCIVVMALLTSTGCGDLGGNNGYGGYSDPYDRGGYSSNDDYYRRRDYERERDERRRLERERDRLEDERHRLEEERERGIHPHYSPPPALPSPAQDRCPPGFSPSERKCTPQDRKHGCRDVRLPSGLGCVNR